MAVVTPVGGARSGCVGVFATLSASRHPGVSGSIVATLAIATAGLVGAPEGVGLGTGLGRVEPPRKGAISRERVGTGRGPICEGGATGVGTLEVGVSPSITAGA